MSIIADAVYEDGMLKLQRPLPFAERQQVRVTVESRIQSSDRLHLGWVALRQLCVEQPIHSGGLRFTREELHDRR